MTGKKTRVLVVDDSALVRQILTQGLAFDNEIEVVATAQDAFNARDKIVQYKPDVMTLDVEMPRMDGVEFLRQLMPQWPIPTIIVSSLTGNGKQVSLEAMEAGAVDIVTKPSADLGRSLPKMMKHLIRLIKGARYARVNSGTSIGRNMSRSRKRYSMALSESTDKVIAMGASTGGTQAIKEIVSRFSSDTPGVVIVQHMPPGFTSHFAKALDTICEMEVKEARTGDRVMNGRILLAPGGMHMRVKRSGGIYETVCTKGPPVSSHCPSIDVLFESVAHHVGPNALGCILTGMGSDGARGLKEMALNGSFNFAQNEKTSVVYGMARVAREMGGVHQTLPLKKIAGSILNILEKPEKKYQGAVL